jgi:uncharacterized protein YkwD
MIAEVALCTMALLCGAEPATQTVAPKPQPPAKVAGVTLLAIEENIIYYTNAERASYGLPALDVDAGLMESARQHATWMTLNQSMVHSQQPVAENIAMGQPDSASVVQCWMNSPGHRANILNQSYRRIGVAAYRTPDGTIFWCQQFLW